MMGYNLIIPILSSLLMIPTAFPNTYPTYNCSTSLLNNTRSIKHLLINLANHTGSNDGWWIGSSDHGSNMVYGFSLCSDGISPEDCRACVVNARSVTRICPNASAAIIWYEDCFLKYSNYSFFGQIDTQIKVIHQGQQVKNATAPAFNVTALALFSRLSNLASDTTNKFMNTSGFQRVGPVPRNVSIYVYATAQCSRDLFHSDCKKCLDGAVEKLDPAKSVRGAFLSGSCLLRYNGTTF